MHLEPRLHLTPAGQYTGNSKPLPEYHVKISSFDEKVRAADITIVTLSLISISAKYNFLTGETLTDTALSYQSIYF